MSGSPGASDEANRVVYACLAALDLLEAGGEPLRGTANARIKTHLDHRIAMSMAVAGLASRDGVEVDDVAPIATSFPRFESMLSAVTPRPA